MTGDTGKSVTQFTILLIFSIFSSAPALAQNCAIAHIDLSTQQSVDNFQSDHGPCDVVTGNLSVGGNDISNLDGLSQLTAVNGNLFISDNSVLFSVLGLASLTMVGGDLTLQANNTLENLNGLNSLQSIWGNFFIFRNDELQHLGGLESLNLVGNRFYLSGNETLTNVHGLESLSSIGSLRIWDNARLSNLDGFAGLGSVHSLEIINSPLVTNLDGFSKLHSVGGDLIIQANSSLVSVQGLSSLVSEVGILAILSNTALTNLDGLDGLTEAGQLIITNNTKLSDCQGVLKLVDISVRSISNNQPGCNSVAEILAAEPFLITAGLNDAWYNSATSGQGFLITVFPDRKEMFLAWFTFDTERPPEDVGAVLGEPGHRWLTAQGPYVGDTANLTIFVTEGGVFDAAEPAATTDLAGDGTMKIEFGDCGNGLVSYEIASLGISGEIPIQRITNDNVALCETLSGQ